MCKPVWENGEIVSFEKAVLDHHKQQKEKNVSFGTSDFDCKFDCNFLWSPSAKPLSALSSCWGCFCLALSRSTTKLGLERLLFLLAQDMFFCMMWKVDLNVADNMHVFLNQWPTYEKGCAFQSQEACDLRAQKSTPPGPGANSSPGLHSQTKPPGASKHC